MVGLESGVAGSRPAPDQLGGRAATAGVRRPGGWMAGSQAFWNCEENSGQESRSYVYSSSVDIGIIFIGRGRQWTSVYPKT